MTPRKSDSCLCTAPRQAVSLDSRPGCRVALRLSDPPLRRRETSLGVAPGSLPAVPRIRTAAAERANRYSEAYAFNVQQPRLPGVQVSHSKRNPAPSNLP